MKEERVKVNGLAEFAHYYNKNTDLILEKIENNRNETIEHFNNLGDVVMKVCNGNTKKIKKIAFWNFVAILGIGALKYTTDKKIDKLSRKIRELEDKQVVSEFKEDDVKLYNMKPCEEVMEDSLK